MGTRHWANACTITRPKDPINRCIPDGVPTLDQCLVTDRHRAYDAPPSAGWRGIADGPMPNLLGCNRGRPDRVSVPRRRRYTGAGPMYPRWAKWRLPDADRRPWPDAVHYIGLASYRWRLVSWAISYSGVLYLSVILQLLQLHKVE